MRIIIIIIIVWCGDILKGVSESGCELECYPPQRSNNIIGSVALLVEEVFCVGNKDFNKEYIPW